MDSFTNLGPADDWDRDFAADILGASILVGLTYLDPDGRMVSRKQVFGIIEAVDQTSGIAIRQRSCGQIFTIAPILDAIEHADPGVYHLADQEEVVEDPDFTALITVTACLKS